MAKDKVLSCYTKSCFMRHRVFPRFTVTWSSVLSVAVDKHHKQKQLWKLRVHLTCRLKSIIKWSQGRKSIHEMNQRPWRNADYWSDAVALLVTILTWLRPACQRVVMHTWTGTTFTNKKTFSRHAHKPIWWRSFPRWGSLSLACQVDNWILM